MIVVDQNVTQTSTVASPPTEETSTPELPHLEFEVAWEGPDGSVSSHRTLECQYVVGGLTPATNYSVVVRALYEDLESEPSDTVVAQTMTSCKFARAFTYLCPGP